MGGREGEVVTELAPRRIPGGGKRGSRGSRAASMPGAMWLTPVHRPQQTVLTHPSLSSEALHSQTK